MKSWLKPIIIFLVALGSLGTIVMLLGIMNITASSGHWAITEWLLSFSMKRSISTYSLLVNEVPNLKDPALILRGAGHYEIGCRQCHGGPEDPSFLGLQSTPKAPYLPPEIEHWKAEELFRIVKHGVKFTGMPAWPALERDDEVWSMVAFLQTLPNLDREAYKALVYGKDSPLYIRPSQFTGEMSRHILITCANCHGNDGNGRGAEAFPRLAGQHKEYLAETLMAYKNGKRNSGTMQVIAHALEKDMIEEISQFYSMQKMRKTNLSLQANKGDSIERGKLIALHGIPEQKVAACLGCHGPTDDENKRKAHFPILNGQPASYLKNQINLILQNKRGGTHHLKLMKKAVRKLTAQQIEDVSNYYESVLQ